MVSKWLKEGKNANSFPAIEPCDRNKLKNCFDRSQKDFENLSEVSLYDSPRDRDYCPLFGLKMYLSHLLEENPNLFPIPTEEM